MSVWGGVRELPLRPVLILLESSLNGSNMKDGTVEVRDTVRVLLLWQGFLTVHNHVRRCACRMVDSPALGNIVAIICAETTVMVSDLSGDGVQQVDREWTVHSASVL